MNDKGGKTCVSKHGSVKATPTVVKNLENFCASLRANKVKGGREDFLKLPDTVQCMFLYYSWEILNHRKNYSDESYLLAFYLFKLFRSKEMKESKIYARYIKLKSTETVYKRALTWNRDKKPSSPVSKTTRVSTPKKVTKYDKEYQKFEELKDENDSLYIYYTSMYSQMPNSRLAITWLTEHGIFEGDERKTLVKKYEKLASKNKLIR